MKISRTLPRFFAPVCFSLIAATPLAHGQATLPAGGGQPSPFGTPAGTSTSGNYQSSTAEGMVDRLFDVNSDSVDMENGSVQWKGRTFTLGNTRAMRARFERYLAAPAPGEEMRRYEEALGNIERLIASNTINKQNYRQNMQEAWNLLFEAGKFEADGENCLNIATLVEKTARIRDEFRGLQVTKNQLSQLRDRQISGVVDKAEVIESKDDELTKLNKGKGTAAKTSQGRTELGYRLEEEKTTQTEIGKTDAEMTLISLKAKIEFQSQIVAFFIQRRFHHAIIACSFYRQLFKGSAQELKVGAKQVQEMFPVSDFVPTIDSVEMISREAIKDVDTGMKAVSQLYDSGERYGAFERLQETFFVGEHEPIVAFYDPEKKRTLLELWRTLRDLQRMGDERDLAGVEGAVNKVKAVAPDFPSAQVMSRVNNAMQTSNLAVISAKQAALAGDIPKAEANIERATKIWPQNPAINEFANQVVSRADLLAQKVPEFDKLYQSGKFREIYGRKEEFAVALLQDRQRAEQLQAVLRNVGTVDGELLKAKVLSQQGNNCMAWDVLHDAQRIDPSDIELAKARSELAPLVGVYANLLAVAERNEKAGNYAAALTNLLSAQDMNPVSEICRQGIQRLGNSIIGQIQAASPATDSPPQ